MAIYRQIHISFWQDNFVLDLTPEEKFFYIYLMTNSKTSQCGVYELPKKVMELETGYNRETIDKLIKRFIEYGKIEYCEDTKEMFLKNWLKYNSFKSDKVMICIKNELEEIKHNPFKIECMNRLSIDYTESMEVINNKNNNNNNNNNQNNNNNKDIITIPYRDIIDYLNFKASRDYEYTTESHRKFIKARWNEKLKAKKTYEEIVNDFKYVIDVKVAEWKQDKNMKQYLRPETLFGTKFDSYLNQEFKQTSKYMTGLEDTEVGI